MTALAAIVAAMTGPVEIVYAGNLARVTPDTATDLVGRGLAELVIGAADAEALRAAGVHLAHIPGPAGETLLGLSEQEGTV